MLTIVWQSWMRYKRFLMFCMIGGSIFLLGLAMMYVQVSMLKLNAQLAFFCTAIVSIETNFILNRTFTWKDRSTSFWRSCLKFNTSRVLTVPLGQLLFAGLMVVIPQYLIATTVHTAIFTVLNFLIGHFWAFRSNKRTIREERHERSTVY